MKSIKLVLVLSAISILFSACYKRNGWGIRGKGSNVTETRNASGFTKIHLEVDAEVLYTQDSVTMVEVVGQLNVLAVLETKVENETLKISYKREVWDHNRIKIVVHSPKLNGLDISGSGNIKAENNIASTHLNVNISGSGNVEMPALTAQSLVVNISGSGNIEIYGGVVTTQNITISGSGNVKCDKLVSTATVCKVSGSGNVTVNVIENLTVSISGSGDVKYTGKPSVSADISGSGRLINF